jgi:chromosome segregation ATPase
MARPLSSDPYRNGNNGGYAPAGRYGLEEAGAHEGIELDNLRSENAQLRQLCGDLEQALQEAAQGAPDVAAYEERMREYDALIEQKNDSIRQLHQQLQDATAALEEAGNRPAGGRRQGPLPAEDELLALSEELEREKRQLQEDEQSLMEQMRQMEMSMARERAEMARQRNDLQRLYGEIRHELERLERNGALQTKMDELKTRLQDAASRRGAAPAQAPRSAPATSTALPNVHHGQQPPPQARPSRGSFMGRLFGGNADDGAK